ncbi:MAG: HAMP domain-containing histidine kinase [Candidatus Omnitrophica bacterium]|nr:HAMP domain-containing histidine kinase [Candidatus Omnitrophota bacterium]
MDQKEPDDQKQGKRPFRFHIVIFFVGVFFTVTLWDAYYNGSRPFDREIASYLILIMGTLFSVAAGLFSWSIETRRIFLEKEVDWRTRDIQAKNKELLNKNEEIENFIHIISHDLKAPIVSIQGFASILKTELGDTLQGNNLDYFNRIQSNVQHMNDLILDLLELSRVGRVEDEKEVVDINDLLKEIIAPFAPELEKKSIRVKVGEYFPNLWGSRKRLEQVFANLIGNAIKYIGVPEQPSIEIEHSRASEEQFCRICVKDNGVGIRKEFQEKIFQIFQRAPNTQKVEGTGIGLSIVKKIVEHNGGQVWVESEEGKGSRFFFEWPNAEKSALAKNHSKSTMLSGSPS